MDNQPQNLHQIIFSISNDRIQDCSVKLFNIEETLFEPGHIPKNVSIHVKVTVGDRTKEISYLAFLRNVRHLKPIISLVESEVELSCYGLFEKNVILKKGNNMPIYPDTVVEGNIPSRTTKRIIFSVGAIQKVADYSQLY